MEMTEQEVLARLLPLIREVTGVRAEQVTTDASLIADLGAESIDLLDLSFLIEETFGVTIESDELERRAVERNPGGEYERDGYLTEEALAQLREALPQIPAEKLQPPMKKIDLPSVLTVGVFVYMIHRKLAAASEEVSHA
jgi:acyl carrier protein